MPDDTTADKEKKRKKQLRKMGKLIATAWEWDDQYHEALGAIGRQLDDGAYNKVGKGGWTAFARDIGSVYYSGGYV